MKRNFKFARAKLFRRASEYNLVYNIVIYKGKGQACKWSKQKKKKNFPEMCTALLSWHY